jgi:preprotein translocase subunit SecD
MVGLFFALPNIVSDETLEKHWPSWLPSHRVNLGLDLRGGSSLLLEVDTKAILKERFASLLNEIRVVLRKEKIGYTHLHSKENSASFTLRNIEDKDKVRDALKFGPETLVTVENDGSVIVSLEEVVLREREKAAVEQSIEIIRRRIDEMGTKEPLIQRQGYNRILVQLPGVDDPSYAKRMIGKTAKLFFHLEYPNASVEDALKGHLPLGAQLAKEEIIRDGVSYTYHLVLQKQALLTGEMLTDAQARQDSEHGGWAVHFSLDAIGAKKFGDITSKNVGRRFAVILDDKVISAPSINMPIPGGQATITGNFTAHEASELAMLLRAGALPAPLSILEERTVGPDLGADSIAAGEKATIVSIILVLVFMFVFYGFVYGGIANVALVLNLIFLISSLSVLQATLTLPGIAGIAISLGMAVDANVLIFERIKEELRNGKKILTAIGGGYHRAMETIIDSNITTLIGAGLLYQFGTGPVRGVAVTLSLGILISMFTAISVTRILIMMWYRVFGPQSLSFGFKGVQK